MKHNVKTEGNVTLSKDESAQALFQYLQQEEKLKEALDAFIKPRFPNVEVSNFKPILDKKGSVSFEISVSDSLTGQAVTDLKQKAKYSYREVPPGEKKQPAGWKRKNVGFYSNLADYLNTERKRRRKFISFEEAAAEMRFLFPDLDDRKMTIYFSDKRQQKSKRFKYDGISKKFIL